MAMNGVPKEYIPPPSFSRKNPFSLLYSALRQGRLVVNVDEFGEHDPQAQLEKISQLFRKDLNRQAKKGQTRRTNIQSILTTIAVFEKSEILRLLEHEPKKVNKDERMNFQKLFNGITPLESKQLR